MCLAMINITIIPAVYGTPARVQSIAALYTFLSFICCSSVSTRALSEAFRSDCRVSTWVVRSRMSEEPENRVLISS